ncbi:hypothetical protein CO015_05465 [candidate division WWE3 bacterium CG_4_8_14_3_um_filter_42_11]|uniref:Uncharacterized protein n=1 Tax=candidate division WWE3 bacterium CG_4_8_14_3_um_filter_42_11 TaxID=1975076 RepID=A0A2M8G5W4_UNCKA|nr:MAG: hypothetical protein CO015_05465 [candidate division WWE3 bacterium CG_4_8_14_3_um_filter_42_11]
MATMIFAMQHNPSEAQVAAARAMGAYRLVAMCATPDPAKGQGTPTEGVEYLGRQALLNVPDDLTLGRDWFIAQALKIVDAVGGVAEGDIVQAMGQQQLAMAVNAAARRAGAALVESVTKRESVDMVKDGTTVKTSVFRFVGYRTLYEF